MGFKLLHALHQYQNLTSFMHLFHFRFVIITFPNQAPFLVPSSTTNHLHRNRHTEFTDCDCSHPTFRICSRFCRKNDLVSISLFGDSGNL